MSLQIMSAFDTVAKSVFFFCVKFGCLDGVIHSSTDQMTRKTGCIFEEVLFWDDQVTANASATTQMKTYFNFKGLGFFKVAILRNFRKCQNYNIL